MTAVEITIDRDVAGKLRANSKSLPNFFRHPDIDRQALMRELSIALVRLIEESGGYTPYSDWRMAT